MCAILLSINPEHVSNILMGNKEYEFRKTECKRKVEKIIIYSTSPIMKVVGEANVDDILIGVPDDIWKKTRDKSGINKNYFDSYYKGKAKAVAYKLSNIIEYEHPKELSEYGIDNAPQSFIYLDN